MDKVRGAASAVEASLRPLLSSIYYDRNDFDVFAVFEEADWGQGIIISGGIDNAGRFIQMGAGLYCPTIADLMRKGLKYAVKPRYSPGVKGPFKNPIIMDNSRYSPDLSNSAIFAASFAEENLARYRSEFQIEKIESLMQWVADRVYPDGSPFAGPIVFAVPAYFMLSHQDFRASQLAEKYFNQTFRSFDDDTVRRYYDYLKVPGF